MIVILSSRGLWWKLGSENNSSICSSIEGLGGPGDGGGAPTDSRSGGSTITGSGEGGGSGFFGRDHENHRRRCPGSTGGFGGSGTGAGAGSGSGSTAGAGAGSSALGGGASSSGFALLIVFAINSAVRWSVRSCLVTPAARKSSFHLAGSASSCAGSVSSIVRLPSVRVTARLRRRAR